MLAGQDYSSRVDSGRQVEKKILDALRSRGIKIGAPTSGQDMSDNIDGWWHGKEGRTYPVQVKFRESGDDVLFEIVKDMNIKKVGRDMKSKSILYLVADRRGNTKLFYTDPFKKKAEEIQRMVEADLKVDPRKTNWEGPGWEAKIQYDRSHGNKKLMAYFNPRTFTPIASWDLNLHEIVLKEILRQEIKSILTEILS